MIFSRLDKHHGSARYAKPGYPAWAALCALLVLPAIARAGNGDVDYTVAINPNVNNANFANGMYIGQNTTNTATVFLTGSGGSGVATVTYDVNNGDNPDDIAVSLKNALLGNPTLGATFNWSVNLNATNPVPYGPSRLPNGTLGFINVQGYTVTGTPINPAVTRAFGAARTTGANSLFPLRVAVALDPTVGQADFELSGTPAGNGEVTLGIDGVQVETNTSTATGVPETDDQIMQTLESELATDGISNATMNLTTDEVMELAVSTGNPLAPGGDLGAFIDSTDTGLSTYAAVLVPEPSSVAMLSAAFGVTLSVKRRKRRR